MDVTKIKFNEDKAGRGKLILFKNKLGTSGKYIARFERRTINDDTIVSRIHERGVGMDDLTVKAVIGLYKKEVVAALQGGEAINLMDLGTMYIRATGSSDSKESAASLMKLEPAFTPSKTCTDAVSLVRINGVNVSDNGPRIESISDLYSGLTSLNGEDEAGGTSSEDGEGSPEPMGLSAGRVVLLKGSRLKVAGKKGGIFFCPVDEDGNAASDRSLYTELPSNRVTRNTLGELEFFIPESLVDGSCYRILVRTNYLSPTKSLKSYREAYSALVKIKKEG